MSKKKRSTSVSPSEPSRVKQKPTNSRDVSEPTKWTRAKLLISVAIVVHFSALLFAISANLAPSYLQGEIMRYLAPYLTTTHQAYGALPIELTHAEPIDFPLQVEWMEVGTSEWLTDETLSPDGSTYSRWPNFARMIRVVAVDFPDSEILSDIALQFIRHIETRTSSEVSAIRFLAPYVPNFDEDAAIAAGRESLVPMEAEVIFGARVVRTDSVPTGLVPTQDASRTSKATSGELEVGP